MAVRRGLLVLWAAGILVGSGCAGSPWTAARPTPTDPAPPRAGAAATEGPSAAAAPPARAPGADRAVAQVDPRAVDELVAQVAAAERLDPAVREQLTRDLCQTDPALWPAFVQQFRASIAYRRGREQRESAAAAATAQQNVPSASRVPVTPGSESREAASAAMARRDISAPTDRSADAKANEEVIASSGPPRLGRLIDQDTAEPAAAFPEAGAFVRRAMYESSSPASPLARDDRDRPGRVTAASQDAPVQEDWRKGMAMAISNLESELRDAPQSAPGVELQARLRMLYLLADRREDALRPIPCASPTVQEFWSQELFGLATWLDSQRVSDLSRRAGQSQPSLAAAVHRLGEMGPLVVRNLVFITEVQSYGIYKPVAKDEFTPGQELLLYAEVENFKSEETPKGFHTVLQASYQIFDSRGQRVAGQELNAVEEHCRNARRDFFLAYRLSLPKRIYAGKHVLQLTLVDQKSQKIGQASIEFSVKDGGQ